MDLGAGWGAGRETGLATDLGAGLAAGLVTDAGRDGAAGLATDLATGRWGTPLFLGAKSMRTELERVGFWGRGVGAVAWGILVLDSFSDFDDVEELVGDETGAADKQAVHAWDGEVGAGVGRADAAAIENRHGIGGGSVIGIGEGLAEEFDGFGDFVGGGEFGAGGGANGPDGFVGDDDATEILSRNFGEAAEELVSENIASFAEGVLGGGFAEAEDGGDLVAEGGGDGSADVFVGEMEELAALGMADEAVIDEAAELGAGDFAGVGTEIMRVGGLGSEADFLAVGLEREGLERNAGRRHHHLKAARTAQSVQEFMKIDGRFSNGEVHLPVAHDV